MGTPSGVTLAPEGGAHQSITTPSIGLEQPGCVSYEPAFAIDVEWTLLACLARLGRPDGDLGLSPAVHPAGRPDPGRRAGRPGRARTPAAGRWSPARTACARTPSPRVTIAAMGAVVPEALAAAERLDAAGVAADVICVTSPGLLFKALLARQGQADAPAWILDQVFPAARATPLVTVLDGHPHTLAFLATINQVPCTTLGVTRFGQSGSLEDVYRYHGIDADSIVRAGLDVADRFYQVLSGFIGFYQVSGRSLTCCGSTATPRNPRHRTRARWPSASSRYRRRIRQPERFLARGRGRWQNCETSPRQKRGSLADNEARLLAGSVRRRLAGFGPRRGATRGVLMIKASRASDTPQTPATTSDEQIGVNGAIAVALTRGVGSMPALYVALVIIGGWMVLATWGPLHRVDPYPFPFLLFLNNVVQLVLCLVILVGQRVLGAAADRRAVETYEHAEAIFEQVADLQGHLDLHDQALSRGVSLLESGTHPWIEQHRVQAPPRPSTRR